MSGLIYGASRGLVFLDPRMRRLFIIRKDLKLKPGKLAAMVGHCCEAYWTNMMKASAAKDNEFATLPAADTSSGERRPMLYRHPGVYAAAKKAFDEGKDSFTWPEEFARPTVTVSFEVPKDVWNDYVNGIFTKTVCECRNRAQLEKAAEAARGLGLSEGKDWGYINDRCLTDLVPENENGTTTVGIWFRPLPDDVAHGISRKFKLYRD